MHTCRMKNMEHSSTVGNGQQNRNRPGPGQPSPMSRNTRIPSCIPNAQMPRTFMSSPNYKIWLEIFNNLDYKDILALRQTNRTFNNLITGVGLGTQDSNNNNNVQPEGCVIWTRGRVVFPKMPETTLAKQNIRWHVLFDEFARLQLVQKSQCPNFRFCCVDLRTGKIDQFFSLYGHQIKEIYIEQCILSMPVFQGIVHKCTKLSKIEISGSLHFLLDAELIFPQHIDNSLTFLRKLKLNCAVTKRRSSIYLRTQEYLIPVYNMSPQVIEDLVSSSPHLRHIEISGFGFQTVLGFIHSLGQNHNHRSDSDFTLIFQNITTEMEATDFHEKISQAHNIKLIKFQLEFHEDLYLLRLLTNNNFQPLPQTEYELTDAAFNRLLTQHGPLLQELHLKFVHVSEGILNNVQRLPKLRKLHLCGTRIVDGNLVRRKVPSSLKELVLAGVVLPSSRSSTLFQTTTATPRNQVPASRSSHFSINARFGFRYCSIFDYFMLFVVLLMAVTGFIYNTYYLFKEFPTFAPILLGICLVGLIAIPFRNRYRF